MPSHISCASAGDNGCSATQLVKASRPPGRRMRKASASARGRSGTCRKASWLMTASMLRSASGTAMTLPSMTRTRSCEPDAARQIVGAGHARRGEVDAGDVGAIGVGEIARRSAEAGAEVGHAGAGADAGALGQRIVGGEAAVVVLVVREKLLGTQVVEVAAARLQLGQDDRGRDRMALVEVDRRADFVSRRRAVTCRRARSAPWRRRVRAPWPRG